MTYEFNAERWLRNNADIYTRMGSPQIAQNMVLCADEIKKLRMAVDLGEQGAEHMVEELAKVKNAVRPVAVWWRKERAVAEPPYQTEHVVLGTDWPECVGVVELDALAALVGEE